LLDLVEDKVWWHLEHCTVVLVELIITHYFVVYFCSVW